VEVTVTRRPQVVVAVTVKLTTAPLVPVQAATMFDEQLMVMQSARVCVGPLAAASTSTVGRMRLVMNRVFMF
jgi:hypothetical protein